MADERQGERVPITVEITVDSAASLRLVTSASVELRVGERRCSSGPA